MSTSGQLRPATLHDTKACVLGSGATAHPEPLNWNSEADKILVTLYKRTQNFDIKHFKSLIVSVSRDSYDLQFLESRLAKLLGPVDSRIDPASKIKPGIAVPNYLHKTWLILEEKDGHRNYLRCVKCSTTSPVTYKNVKTQQLRCGHCGNMDFGFLMEEVKVHSSHNASTLLQDEKHQETVQQSTKSQTRCLFESGRTQQDNKVCSAEGSAPTVDLNNYSTCTAVDMPEHWNVVTDMYLKQWYNNSPKRFDIDKFKTNVHKSFHGPSNLCINPDSYDFGFLHNRLDRLIGPCVCRWSGEDRANLTQDHEPSFFHREWRSLAIDHLGHRLYCGRCKISPPLICKSEKINGLYRCGACGNSEISRMPSDEPYFEHLNRIVDGLNCVLGKRKAAGLPDVPMDKVYADVRKRMRIFQRDRPDKPKLVHESFQADGQEVVRVTMESIHRQTGGGRVYGEDDHE